MTAKEWLSRYKVLTYDIEAQKESLARLTAAATSTTAKNNGGMPGGSGVSRKIETAVVNADVIKAQIRDMQREQRAITQAINKLTDPQSRAVLTYIYICGLTQEETARRIGYQDPKTIRQKRDAALRNIRVPNAYKIA